MDIEATQPLPIPYALTDGCTTVEVRWMTAAEFAEANERAGIATGSAWEWVPWSEGEHGHWSKYV